MKRLESKVALIVGGGQIPGETIGNGRATALTFAKEGARLMIADRGLDSAQHTVELAQELGAEAFAVQGDVTEEASAKRFVEQTMTHFGRVDILQNNVGVSDGDCGPLGIEVAHWRNILDVNLTGMLLTAKHVLPIMQTQGGGVITNISSIISITSDAVVYGGEDLAEDSDQIIGYRVSKTGVNSLTESLAMSQARHGIRVNAILPGLMHTSNAIEGTHQTHLGRDDLIRKRDAQVPLGGKQGTGWDVANAALFLASEEARFITGALLPVDGGQCLRRG